MAIDSSSGAIEKEAAPPSINIGRWLKQRWLLIAFLIIALYVGLPWLAPIFMSWGWTKLGNAIYILYATQCHQMPQRSFFLFGDSSMYSLTEVQAVWENSANPLILRQFNGNPEMGWKVAWSDRMVYMYTSIIIWGIVFYKFLRQNMKPIPWWAFALLLLPMAIDGGTHFLSDILGGIGGGFRDSNLWLASLTDNTFPATFYAGDALGSFNSWMRLITGILFGLGVVLFIFPYLQRSFKYE